MLKRLLRFLGLAVFIFSLFALGYVSNNFISRNDAPQYQEVANPADYLFLLDEKIDFAVEGHGGRRGSLGKWIENILNDPAGWRDTGLSFDFDTSTLGYKNDGIETDYGELGIEMVFYLTKDKAELEEFCGPNVGACMEKKKKDHSYTPKFNVPCLNVDACMEKKREDHSYTPKFNVPCLIIFNSSQYEKPVRDFDFFNIVTINHEVGHCLGLSHGKYGAVSKHWSSMSAYPALSDIRAVQKARLSLIDELGYDSVSGKGFGEDGIGIASKDGKIFHIYLDGSRLYEEEYDYVDFGFYDGISIVRENDKYFHITMDGNPIYEERYDSVDRFREGLAKVEQDGKQFHIRVDGELLYEEKYDYVSRFSEGLARVEQDGKQFHVRADGELLYEEKYDSVSRFREGLAKVEQDGKQFHIRTDGKPLYEERYDYVLIGVDGLIFAYNDTDQSSTVFVACINRQGEVVSTEKEGC